MSVPSEQKQAQQLLQYYNTGPALLQFHHTIQKAREARKEDEESGNPDRLRPDAWRYVLGMVSRAVSLPGAESCLPPYVSPDMTPQALMAAHNLPQYDAVYDRLRTEYLEVRAR